MCLRPAVGLTVRLDDTSDPQLGQRNLSKPEANVFDLLMQTESAAQRIATSGTSPVTNTWPAGSASVVMRATCAWRAPSVRPACAWRGIMSFLGSLFQSVRRGSGVLPACVRRASICSNSSNTRCHCCPFSHAKMAALCIAHYTIDGVPGIMEASAAVTVRIREHLHVLGVELRDLIKLIRCPLLSTRRAGCQPFFHF
jgi:hypothetical protein